MRCSCCNKTLSDYEATLRHAETGAFLDTCLRCLDGLGIPTVNNTNNSPYNSQEDLELDFVEETDE